MNDVEFWNLVYGAIRKRPELLDVAMSAATTAMKHEVQDAWKDAALADAGLLSALCLMQEKRVDQSVKDALSPVIVRALNRRNVKAPIEKEVLNVVGEVKPGGEGADAL